MSKVGHTVWAIAWGIDGEADLAAAVACSTKLHSTLHVVHLKHIWLGDAQEGPLADAGDVAAA